MMRGEALGAIDRKFECCEGERERKEKKIFFFFFQIHLYLHHRQLVGGVGEGMFLCGRRASRPCMINAWSMYIISTSHKNPGTSARTAESGQGGRGWHRPPMR